jgi:hypothetical protein
MLLYDPATAGRPDGLTPMMGCDIVTRPIFGEERHHEEDIPTQ